MLERARDFIALKTFGQCDIGNGSRWSDAQACRTAAPMFLHFVDEGYAGCQAMSRGVISGAKKIAALSENNLWQFLESKVLAHRLAMCLEDG